MKISCDIIQDLLPLYAEDMVSQDSKDMVEEHLKECEGCTKELEGLKSVQKLPGDVNTQALCRVKHIIRRKRILSVFAALLFTVSIIMAGALLLDARIYLSAEDAVEGVQVLEDGRIRILWGENVIGHGSCHVENAENWGVIAWTNLRKLMSYKNKAPRSVLPPELQTGIPEEAFSSSTYPLKDDTDDWNVWYVRATDGTGEKLLWDANKSYGGEMLMQSMNYHLAVYVAALAAICILAFTGYRVMKHYRKLWIREICFRIAAMAGSLCISTVIVTAGQFMEIWGEFTEGVREGSLLSLPLVLAILFTRQLYLLNLQDKGI